MSHALFDHILTDLVTHEPYFRQMYVGQASFSPHQKLMVVLQMLTYGCAADQLDEYIWMAESTVLKNFKVFCQLINECYGQEYLHAPTKEDIEFVLRIYASKGWLGMLGSLDIMHWEWKNFPVAHQGSYIGKEGIPMVALEAAVDTRLLFWHAWFGMPGSNNNLNILDCSPFFQDLLNGRSPMMTFIVVIILLMAFILNGKFLSRQYVTIVCKASRRAV